MAKVFTYVMILMGLSLLLSFAGIPTASYKIVNAVVGNNTITSTGEFNQTAMDIHSSNLKNWGIGIFLAATEAAIAATFLFHSTSESGIIAPFAAILFGYVLYDSYSIITYAFGHYDVWVAGVMTLIIAPLIVGFIIAMISWWRGADA